MEYEGSTKKIVHVINNFDDFYLNFFKCLGIKFNHRAFYFREIERGLPSINEDYVDIRLNYSKKDRYFFRNRSRKISKDLENTYDINEVQLLHAHTLFTNGYVAYLLNKKHSIPYIVAVRATDIDQFFRIRKNLYFLGLRVLKNASKIVFISDSGKKMLFQKYIPKRYSKSLLEKSVVIPNGVDNLFLTQDSTPKEDKNNRDINILTVGLLSKRKNQILVSEAAQKLIDQGYNITYTVIGRVLDKEVYNELITKPFVNYLPFLDSSKLIEYYRKSDVYVMPSLSETFGITYIEAISQGLPVIYSENSGIDGMFEDTQIGSSTILDSDHLANVIIDVVSRANELSINAIKASKKFEWSEIQKTYDSIYNHILI